MNPSLSYITDVDRSCLTVGTELSTDAKTLPSTILSKVRFFYWGLVWGTKVKGQIFLCIINYITYIIIFNDQEI